MTAEDPAIPGIGDKFERLVGIMARLRGDDGCPWDLEQDAKSLSRHLLEEAYEALEAIDRADWDELEEELGDLLLQIVFQAQIASDEGRFDIGDVVDSISDKLERRHPHIFGDEVASTPEEVSMKWDRIKREEKDDRHLMELPRALPALLAALKVQGQAAREGFDWVRAEDVFEKLKEEMRELWESRERQPVEFESEVGDLLFTVVNLSRHYGVEPEAAMRGACRKFVERYRVMVHAVESDGKDFSKMPLSEKDEYWEYAKNAVERTKGE